MPRAMCLLFLFCRYPLRPETEKENSRAMCVEENRREFGVRTRNGAIVFPQEKPDRKARFALFF